jgi:glycosyltransferase involved in cell wall biosynthesis
VPTPSPVHVCTIAARNYLSRVRVLAGSFFEVHPDGVFHLCVVDDRAGEVELADEGIQTIRLHELSIDDRTLRAMALYYDVLEFSTALKPWVLEAALRQCSGAVLYLDPDIEIFGPLDELNDLAVEHDIVLTPHVLEPMPRDGLDPGERVIMRSGMYNLGFLGLGRDTAAFLEFWKERLRVDAIVSPDDGLFTDQRWIDFVPAFFPHLIHRDPGCNVAYWNAHERTLHSEGDSYFVCGRPLRFVHFSGFDVEHPHLLSKHAVPHPRVLLSEHPILQELCTRYARRVHTIEAEGHEVKPYAWQELDNGLPLDPVLRGLYRRAVVDAESGLAPEPPDLTAPNGVSSLMTWLCELTADRGLPRYVEAVLAERPDVALAFRDMTAGDTARFVSWLRTSASREMRTGPRLIAELEQVLTRLQDQGHGDHRERPGGSSVVEVVGHLQAESGVGEATRRTLSALRAAGLAYQTTEWYRPCRSRCEAEPPAVQAVSRLRSDISLLHVNADVLPALNHDLGTRVMDGHYRIGVWFWELQEFPEHLHQAFDLVDEVWVASHFQYATIGARAPVPVMHMPLPLSAPSVAPHLTRADFGFADEHVFLFVFDLLSVIERKNPFDLIYAYKRAFDEGGQTRLILKTINGDERPGDLERLKMAVSDRDDIEARDGYMRPDEIGALIASCDCYVSLHRSEGLGLTIAEAMALGKPVIATAYSGNVDFMTVANSYPVGYSLTPVGPGNDPYDPNVKWAQPDIDEAVELMRRVVENPQEARSRAASARADFARRFSPDACGRKMATRISEIRSRSNCGI